MNRFSTKNTVLCALFIALITVSAYIKIPLPFVPFTLQTLFVMLAGMLLGPKFGTLSVFMYMVLGLLGLPVFTGGGGISYILKPTFGYILGFVACAFVSGYFVSKGTDHKNLIKAALFGSLVIYIFGMGYFYILSEFLLNSPVEISSFFVNFLFLTLPGDIIKSIAAVLLSSKLTKSAYSFKAL